MRAVLLLLLAAGCTTASAEPRPRAVDPLADEREVAATAPEHQPVVTAEGIALGGGTVSPAGTTIGRGTVQIALAAFGRDGALIAGVDAEPVTVGPEVRIARGAGVTEWWRSLPSGLEQGVTVESRPEGEGPLLLEMSVGAGVRPEGEGAIALRDAASGESLGTYTGLLVVDADGAAITSRMTAVGERIRIEIDDDDARYPITVDPLVAIEETSLPPIGGVNSVSFGAGVAIDATGSTVLVGEPMDRSSGNALVAGFLRTGTTWSHADLPELFAPNAGAAVALSAAGDRAIVSDPTSVSSCPNGCAYFYARSGTSWTRETLFADFMAAEPAGSLVAMSGDGLRALVATRGTVGSVRVYARTGTSWTLETTVSASGTSIHLDDDGNTALVGGNAARVFTRAGTTWAPASAPSGECFVAALSADGARLACSRNLVGGERYASIFVRAGTTWSEESRLFAGGITTTEITAAALTDDGGAVLLGERTSTSTVTFILFTRAGGTWTEVATVPFSVPDSYRVSLDIDATGRRAIIGSPQSATGSGEARIFTFAVPNGDPCVAGSECYSGFCVDGVCCNTACAGGTSDCQACAAAMTGAASGTCAPIRAGSTCRAAAGVCDLAETCNGAATTCPSDSRSPTTSVCRPVASACDAEERCNGVSVDCPANMPAIGDTICHPSAGSCDYVERCDGVSYLCATDGYLSSGTACGGSMAGACSTAGTCNGTSPNCPGTTPLPASTVCLPADPTNPCDLPDHCSGVDDVCRPQFAPDTTSCGGAPSGDCDAQDHCSGTSGDCEAEFLVAVVCRAGTASCDVPEVCLGDSPDCPADAVAAAGLTCRDSTMACDAIEVCDGTAATCPADVISCGDAGVTPSLDGGGDVDAAAPPATDGGGMPSVAATGCGCRATHARGGGAMLGLLLTALARRRRRR